MTAAKLSTSLFIYTPIESSHESLPVSSSFLEIGALHERVRKYVEERQPIPGEVLIRLGVGADDEGGKFRMNRILTVLHSQETKFVPSAEFPGVYFIYFSNPKDPKDSKEFLKVARKEQREPILVFKSGEKRATVELVVRKIAILLRLERYALPGVFAAIKGIIVDGEEEFCMETWNGWNKILRDDGVTENSMIFGLLEPFIKGDKPFNKEDTFPFFIVFALALNIRDLSFRNVIDGVCIDQEECMVSRTPTESPKEFDFTRVARFEAVSTPDQFKLPTTHIPVLANGDPEKIICARIRAELLEIIAHWDVEKIIETLKKECIEHFDTAVEAFDPPVIEQSPIEGEFLAKPEVKLEESFLKTVKIEDGSDESEDELDDDDVELQEITDHGFCKVDLRRMYNGDAMYIPRKVEPGDPVFTKRQLDAFRVRLEKLKEVIGRPSDISVLDILKHVDPLYVEHVEAFSGREDILRGQSPYLLAGRIEAPIAKKSTSDPRSKLGTFACDK